MPYFDSGSGFTETFHQIFPTQEDWIVYWRKSPYFIELNVNSAKHEIIKDVQFETTQPIARTGITYLRPTAIYPEPQNNNIQNDTGKEVIYSTNKYVVYANLKTITKDMCELETTLWFPLENRQEFTLPTNLIFPAVEADELKDSQGRQLYPEVRYKGEFMEIYSVVIGIDGDNTKLKTIKSNRLNEYNFYWDMIAHYGASHTRYMENQVFKNKISYELNHYGVYYYERLKQLQNQLYLTLDQFADEGETIQNTAYNPANDTIDTDSTSGMGFVNNQNRYKKRLGDNEAIRKKYQGMADHITEEFFDRFKDFFRKICSPQGPDYQYFIPEKD